MRPRRAGLTFLVILASTVSAFAQAAPSPTTAPAKTPAVLSLVPSGTMGFVVVNNVKATMGNVDKFLADIGIKNLIPADNMTALLMEAARLGEGFNPDAGAAAAMLDPTLFGKGLASPQQPFAIYVPGASVKGVFGNYTISRPEGSKYDLVQLRMGPMFATYKSGYVILSPLPKVLDTISEIKTTAEKDLTKGDVDVLKSSDVGVFINMKVTGPLVSAMLTQAEMMMKRGAGEEGSGATPPMLVFKEYRKLVSEMESAVAGVQFGNDGLGLQVRFGFLKDSDIAKSLAAASAIGQLKLDRMVNNKYIIAMQGTPESMKGDTSQIDALKKDPTLAKVKPETWDKLKKLAEDCRGELTGWEAVVGQPPAGKGVVSAGFVLEVKDSAKVRDLIGQGVALGNEIIAAMTESGPMAGVKLTYDKSAQKVEGLDVDSIDVVPPQEAAEQAADQLEKALGTRTLRLLVAAPDAKTLIMTLGGGNDFMAQAIKAAKTGDSNILTQQAKDALAKLPPKQSFVMLVNVANILAMVKKASPDEDVPTLTTQTPVVLGAGVADNGLNMTIFAQKKLVGELVVKILQSQGIMPAEETPATAPAPKGK